MKDGTFRPLTFPSRPIRSDMKRSSSTANLFNILHDSIHKTHWYLITFIDTNILLDLCDNKQIPFSSNNTICSDCYLLREDRKCVWKIYEYISRKKERERKHSHTYWFRFLIVQFWIFSHMNRKQFHCCKSFSHFETYTIANVTVSR